ncbi:hypothetical protein Taro_050412 [Colocasia esculenta]|uniref:Uncharacterized protein n=1 Tax=Colocasia esculenta TaxID=4460 RepID=A0A843XDU6_COLES|nr:hypothetical protein [Colocasia esculenta]
MTVWQRTPATASPYLKRVGGTTQCGSKPSTHTCRDKEAHGTPEQPRETRVSRHITNIPDLHEVKEEQPGVTMRDTEQPREKQHLTIGTATSDLHKVEGPQAEPPAPRTRHEVRELHPTVPPQTAPRNELQKL